MGGSNGCIIIVYVNDKNIQLSNIVGGSNDCIIIVYVKGKNIQLSNIVGEVMIVSLLYTLRIKTYNYLILWMK